jgi:hypothetical protein
MSWCFWTPLPHYLFSDMINYNFGEGRGATMLKYGLKSSKALNKTCIGVMEPAVTTMLKGLFSKGSLTILGFPLSAIKRAGRVRATLPETLSPSSKCRPCVAKRVPWSNSSANVSLLSMNVRFHFSDIPSTADGRRRTAIKSKRSFVGTCCRTSGDPCPCAAT